MSAPMDRAIALSWAAMNAGEGGPFGAVIVRDGVVIAEGANCVTSTNDPTAHAEITAIRRACSALGTFTLQGCVLYTSCEPCPMCLAAAYWARVDRVVYASTRATAAAAGFDDAFLYEEVAKAPGERSLPLEHAPSTEADEAFAAWIGKADKVPY